MHFSYNFLLLLAVWRWGDWRNWEKYYPTILFFILCDFLHNFLAYNHSLWLFHENLLQTILPNHTTISFIIMFIAYPSTILIYLPHFFKTDRWSIRIIHYALWVVLYISIEGLGRITGYISYHNGWHLGYSIIFVLTMFIIFPIHHKKPLFAWVLTFGIIILMLTQFEFSLDKMK